MCVVVFIWIFFQGDDLTASTTRASFPLPEAYPAEAPRKITAEEREFKAYRALRDARANQRHEGARKARQAKVRLLPPLILFLSNAVSRKTRRKQTRRRYVSFTFYRIYPYSFFFQ
jgi:hypothetical protein